MSSKIVAEQYFAENAKKTNYREANTTESEVIKRMGQFKIFLIEPSEAL